MSLETSDNQEVAGRALALHQTLHSKHSTLVNVRFLEFAKASYEYQSSITAEVSGHREGVALLGGWYGLVSEKKAWKHDFLKQICRVFDYDLSGKAAVSVNGSSCRESCSLQPDVGLVLYVCDNLATLEYKLQEEVMTVVHLLSGVVSQATGLVMILESFTLGGSDDDDIHGMEVPTAEVSLQRSI